MNIMERFHNHRSVSGKIHIYISFKVFTIKNQNQEASFLLISSARKMMNGKVFVLQSHLDLVSKSQTFVVSKMLQELSSADR